MRPSPLARSSARSLIISLAISIPLSAARPAHPAHPQGHPSIPISNPPPTPPSVGRDDLSPYLASALEATPIPALAAAAIVDGQLHAVGVAGLRRAGSPEQVTLQDKFHIGSCTKSMTATLAALLVSEGLVSWDTTLGVALPDVDIHPGYHAVTLAQLLSNTGGAPHSIPPPIWNAAWAAAEKEPPLRQRELFASHLLALPPERPPGTAYLYSNTSFTFTNRMLELAADAPFEELLTSRLFTPLQMSSAGFRAPSSPDAVDHPHGHVLGPDGKPRPVDPLPRGDNPPAIAPAGTVHASILDLATYARFHLRQVGRDLLDKEALAFLHRPAPHADGYARGWQVVQRPWAHGDALTHSGSNTMFYTVIWLAPERNFAAIIACNLGGAPAPGVCDQVAAHLIHTYLPEETPDGQRLRTQDERLK